MKKKIGITVAMVAMLMFGLVGGVYGATSYIEWSGSNNYRQTVINLEDINEGINKLQTDKQNLVAERDNLVSENETTGRDNERLINDIKNLDNQIISLEQNIVALEKRIQNGETTQDMLIQADKDMSDVEIKSREVLENLK